MDCAFVASSPHVYGLEVTYQQMPAGKENVHLQNSFEAYDQTQIMLGHPTLTSTLSASLNSIDVQHLSPSSSSTASSSQSTQCRCIIDTTNPTNLERDFYAWLQGNEVMGRNTPCTFQNAADIDLFESLSPGTSHCSEASSSNQESSMGKQKNRRKRNVDKGRGTNLYGRPYCPGRPLSMDERYQIIQLFQAGMKVNAISKQLCISHGCVSKIITRFRDTGLLIPSSHAECRRRKRLQMEASSEQMG